MPKKLRNAEGTIKGAGKRLLTDKKSGQFTITELPLPKIGIINIDTGCVFERKLTAMIVEGGSFKLVGTEYNA